MSYLGEGEQNVGPYILEHLAAGWFSWLWVSKPLNTSGNWWLLFRSLIRSHILCRHNSSETWLGVEEKYPEPTYESRHAFRLNLCSLRGLGAVREDEGGWPLDDVLLLLDGLSQWLSEGHLGKVLQGSVDSVPDGVIEHALHPAHQHLQAFDHGDHL